MESAGDFILKPRAVFPGASQSLGWTVPDAILQERRLQSPLSGAQAVEKMMDGTGVILRSDEGYSLKR